MYFGLTAETFPKTLVHMTHLYIKTFKHKALKHMHLSIFSWKGAFDGFLVFSASPQLATKRHCSGQHRRGSKDFELWDKLRCRTLPDSFSPPRRYVKEYVQLLTNTLAPFEFFALFAVLQFPWDFMPKSYTKFYMRVRRKFYKFVKACEVLTTRGNHVIFN